MLDAVTYDYPFQRDVVISSISYLSYALWDSDRFQYGVVAKGVLTYFLYSQTSYSRGNDQIVACFGKPYVLNNPAAFAVPGSISIIKFSTDREELLILSV